MKPIIKDALLRAGLYPIARSLYRKLSPLHRRQQALRTAFLAQLTKPGDLCFDVGGNLGQTVESLRACGARVVTIEPNPACLPTLRYSFGKDPQVVIVNKAVGAEPGVAMLHCHGTSSTASLRDGWWKTDDEVVETEVVTLGRLMDEHGPPQFMKVDVEGFEVAVFQGLDRPVPIITFEMHAAESAEAVAVLDRLSALGTIQGVNAVNEDHDRWLLDRWVPPSEFLTALGPPPNLANVVVRMG